MEKSFFATEKIFFAADTVFFVIQKSFVVAKNIAGALPEIRSYHQIQTTIRRWAGKEVPTTVRQLHEPEPVVMMAIRGKNGSTSFDRTGGVSFHLSGLRRR